MRAIMIMYDSLNRRMLPNYGDDKTIAPNFKRLGERTVKFNNSYVGSMPCMPARREIQTGRYNFLHASWGPIEPFDRSMPEILKHNGIYTHLVSDHYHYWEDGGLTYHQRYSTWDMIRGQEGDPWKAEVSPDPLPKSLNNNRGSNDVSPSIKQDWINRKYMTDEDEFSQVMTFSGGAKFIETNHDADNWFLHIETFDPHEPYYSHEKYKELYPHNYDGEHYDWPSYKRVDESPELVEHIRYENRALLSMCDAQLGRILDMMDEYDMWKDTMLIVNTDHGFLLGEHGWWAKCVMPFYNEVAHTPLFIWDPRLDIKNAERNALVQTIDLAPTLLEFFDVEIPNEVQGKSLKTVIKNDEDIRKGGLYGVFGGQVNVTDGRYVYMRAPENADNLPLYEYTLMPTQHGSRRAFVEIDRLKKTEFVDGFEFMQGCPVMKIPGKSDKYNTHKYGTLLFDLENDPKQENPIKDVEIETYMIDMMIELMAANECPIEQYERLGLPIQS